MATDQEDGVNIAESSFADTLLLELTSLLLSGELKIYFASVGTRYAATIPFNTVREALYQTAIGLILDSIDHKESTGDYHSSSMLKTWPLKFHLEADRYRPKSQRLITAMRWNSIESGFERALCPAGALLVTERQLISILEQETSPRQLPGDPYKFGGIITYFPLLRLSDFHISHHEHFGVLALLVNAAHGSEKLEIVFPSDREKAVLRTMQWALVK